MQMFGRLQVIVQLWMDCFDELAAGAVLVHEGIELTAIAGVDEAMLPCRELIFSELSSRRLDAPLADNFRDLASESLICLMDERVNEGTVTTAEEVKAVGVYVNVARLCFGLLESQMVSEACFVDEVVGLAEQNDHSAAQKLQVAVVPIATIFSCGAQLVDCITYDDCGSR